MPAPAQAVPEPAQAVPEPAQAAPKPAQAVPAPAQAVPEPAQAVSEPAHKTDSTPTPMLKVDSSKWDARIAALEAENRDLKRDLEASLTADVKKNVAISGNNWNLEKATLRYQEAERQMRSLGQKLQKERAQCRLEQQELETMLFDPTLTNERQLATLADLEAQLARAQEELINQRLRYEAQLEALR